MPVGLAQIIQLYDDNVSALTVLDVSFAFNHDTIQSSK